jgi:ketol-acid reductoisomerase
MASRSFSRALRSPLARQLAAPAVQTRSFVAAAGAIRATVASARSAAPAQQQVRGVKTIDFAGSKEDVYGASLAIFYFLGFYLPRP